MTEKEKRISRPLIPLATAIREVWRQGYSTSDLFSDFMAGFTVCILAIPMTMAVAIASGVQPEHGLYGAMIAGPLIALLGGARLSVTGPVAELAVLIYPVVYQYGFGGLMLATWMAGMILLLMGIAKLGRVIEFIPYPVTTGFIAGTGIVISALQIKDFFGLTLLTQPKYFLERMVRLAEAMPTLSVGDTMVGVITLFVLIIWPKLKKPFFLAVPSHLAAMLIGSLFAYVIIQFFPNFSVDTIGTRYQGIPQTLPTMIATWNSFDVSLIRDLFGSAFAIAMLCAIKALLCAVVLDGMNGTKHNPNSELIAHGIGNLVLPFFGGLPATSALSRSVANWRVGAKSPVAAIVHGISILIVVLILAPILSYLPMAGLAALLLIAAWNIFDVQHCIRIVRIGTRSDIAVLLICFSLTVLLDMVIAVGIGMVLAALLFMKQMANISGGKWLLHAKEWDIHEPLPMGVMVYEISGPLFFGAAEKAMSTLRENSQGLQVVILHMKGVPTMDISGVVALKSAIDSLHKQPILVILADIQEQPMTIIKRSRLKPETGKMAICDTLSEAIELARRYC